MSEHDPFTITRFMNPYAQAALARRVSKLAGIELTEPGLESLTHGEAGVELITKQQYGKALTHPGGVLHKLDGDETQGILQYHLGDTRRAQTESKILIGETEPAETRTRGVKALIYYPVRIAELADESERMAHTLDELNGVSMNWGRLHPRLVIAVVPRRLKQAQFLTEIFEAARPVKVILMRTEVVWHQELVTSQRLS
jgi:hypothetical protein